ncbi:MAG TPA: hypothetical protein VLL25_07800 [Acidimicrobiales bacterium]|nr:hypothetical protein [Acidimicrobiales bacterium]
MTAVEFFFDPSCPWTWVASRFVATVSPHRDLAVTWRTWSLPMKNEGRELPAKLPAEWRERILRLRGFSVSALRVLEAAGAAHGNPAIGRLYTELGRRVHRDGALPDGVIEAALAASGLPAQLISAADDPVWDEPIRDNMDDVRREIGDEVGVPIVTIVADGKRRAMAGPILADVPALGRALPLWDAVALIVDDPAVFELKRHRTAGPVFPVLDSDGRAAS